MPDLSERQGEPAGHRPRILSLWGDGSLRAPVKLGPKAACHRLAVLLVWLASVLWAGPLLAQRSDAPKPDVHRFDIGIIIDNRPLPRSVAAKADVDGLVRMLDRQMFIEHVMVFERPTIEVICDIFGCPEVIEDINPFPSLIWQITREEEARLFVYYIGDGRIEGLERQLLFRRGDNDDAAGIEGLSVDWLHAVLEDARPASAVLMLDTSFSPRKLPCADEDPRLIDAALTSVRSAYRNVMRERWNQAGVLELSATTSVQPPHCDRFEQLLDDREQPLFTKFLLKAIVEGKADEEPFGDEDRLIELGELEAYLDDRIKRAARFQWGRSQNVRAVGPRSKVLASLDGRKLSAANRDVVARRNRPQEEDTEEPGIAAPADSPEPGGGGQSGTGDDQSGTVRTVRASTCRGDPSAPGCHPCVIDPSGPACAERCREDGGADLCAPNLSTTTEGGSALQIGGAGNGARETEVTSGEGGTDQPAEDATGERSSACVWVAGNVAPYAVSLVQLIRGGTDTSCGWADDRSDVELGPFAQIFTPIAWRLGRETAQDAVSCLLDCDSASGSAEAQGSPTAAKDGSAVDENDAALNQAIDVAEREGTPLDRPATVLPTSDRDTRPSPVDPRTLSAFNREICDQLGEPLPPYIGLPRWMPGTLIISEALRAGYGCAPPPAEAVLPTPFAVAIEAPAEVKTPTPDGAPAVASADRRLSRWPSSSAGVGPAADPSIGPSADEADEQPDDVEIGARIASSTPISSDGPAEEQGDLPEVILPNEKPFERTVSKVRWLQSALTVDNRHPGPIDGIIGKRTEAAIRSWRRDHERESRTGPLTEPEFREIIRDFGQRFGQIEERAQSF